MFIHRGKESLELDAAPSLNIVSLRRLEFKLGLKRGYLRSLAAHARGHYNPFVKPEKYRPFQKVFKKPKQRLIDNPDEELKEVQKRIYRRLLRLETLPGYICGGVKGKSLLDNVKLHPDVGVLVTVDIANFFPSVTSQYVYFLWNSVLNCSPEISALLTKLTSFERHLPQGAATSTPLANILICAIDQEIRTECERMGVKYSTWVDDLAFSGANARHVIPVVISALSKAGLRVSRKKIKVMGTGRRKVLNGIVLGKVPTLPRENLSRIRSGIHKLAIGEVNLDSYEEYVQSLIARIRQAQTINASQALKLRLQLIDVLKKGSFPKAFRRRYLRQLSRPTHSPLPRKPVCHALKVETRSADITDTVQTKDDTHKPHS
jgi:hypothetical protein